MFMTEASTTTKASPEAIWKLWSDVSSWNRWDDGVEVELNGLFATGTSGTLTPTGAGGLAYKIIEATPHRSFTDVTDLPGAQLTGFHSLEVTKVGTKITHRIEISGPAWHEYAEGLGKELERDLPNTVAKLAQVAESLEGNL